MPGIAGASRAVEDHAHIQRTTFDGTFLKYVTFESVGFYAFFLAA